MATYGQSGVLKTAYVFIYSQNNEVDVFIVPIFQMKRLRG